MYHTFTSLPLTKSYFLPILISIFSNDNPRIIAPKTSKFYCFLFGLALYPIHASKADLTIERDVSKPITVSIDASAILGPMPLVFKPGIEVSQFGLLGSLPNFRNKFRSDISAKLYRDSAMRFLVSSDQVVDEASFLKLLKTYFDDEVLAQKSKGALTILSIFGMPRFLSKDCIFQGLICFGNWVAAPPWDYSA